MESWSPRLGSNDPTLFKGSVQRNRRPCPDGQNFPLAGAVFLRQVPQSSDMADVRIIFSPDRAPAAERLREAVSAEGYDVVAEPIKDVEELIAAEDRLQKGTATLIIWSRSLVLSALQPGVLRQLRQRGNLIEVSPDGVGPQAADGDTNVILISGWRGQPFHPGWQRIAGDLKRLCGPPKENSEAAVGVVQPEPIAAPLPVLAESKPSDRPSRARGWALAAIGAIALFGAGFGAASWIGNRGSEPGQPPPARMQERQPAQVPLAERPQGSVFAQAESPAPPRPSGSAPSESSDGGAATNQPATAAAPAPAAAVPAPADAEPRSKRTASKEKESASRTAKNRSAARVETKRYSRANSEVMRLFCEGSGRSTPQCRTFLRSVRGKRR